VIDASLFAGVALAVDDGSLPVRVADSDDGVSDEEESLPEGVALSVADD
jgi:hypothetical protein